VKLRNEEFIVNQSTGETVYNSKTYATKVKDTETFYMVFLEFIGPLFGVKSLIHRKILDSLCNIAEFNTGKVLLTSATRKAICDKLEIGGQTFNNALVKLKKLGLLHGERGQFELNPKIFWKGTTDQRRKLLREQGLELNIKFKADELQEN
jgi:hypothetical protein